MSKLIEAEGRKAVLIEGDMSRLRNSHCRLGQRQPAVRKTTLLSRQPIDATSHGKFAILLIPPVQAVTFRIRFIKRGRVSPTWSATICGPFTRPYLQNGACADRSAGKLSAALKQYHLVTNQSFTKRTLMESGCPNVTQKPVDLHTQLLALPR